AELENLETLSISHSSKITDDGVAHLSPLANLEGLFLHDNDLVSGAVMTRFRSLKKLKRLAINAAEVNSEDLRHLAEFDSLESLSVARTNVDDTGIKSLVAPKSLKALNIHETRITDTGLAMLGKAKQLASLGLSKTAKQTMG